MPTDGLPPGYRKQDALSVRLHDLVDALESQVPPGRPPLPVRSSRPASRRQLAGQLAVALSVIGVLTLTVLGRGDGPDGAAVVPTDRTSTFAPSVPVSPPAPVAPTLDGPAAPPDDTASAADAPAPRGASGPDDTPDPDPPPAATRNRAPARNQQGTSTPPTSTSPSSPSSAASSPQPDGGQSDGGQSNGKSKKEKKEKKEKKPKKGA